MEQSLYELPEGWEYHPIGDVVSLISGQHLKKDEYTETETPESVPYLTGPAEFGELSPEPKRWTMERRSVAISGDTLITVKGSGVGKVNKVFAPAIAISRQLMAVRPSEVLDSDFLYLYFQAIQDVFAAKKTGAAIPGIGRRDVLQQDIPLPPLNEQKRIVAKLDALFTRIDAAITHLQETLELSKALFASALDGAFRECEAESVSLTEVVEFIGGSQPPKSEFSEVAHDGYVRLIQIRDYKSDAHVVYVNAKSTKKFCKKDDVMIGRYGPPVFQILRGLDGAYNVALMKASPDENVLSKDYLFWFLQSSSIQGYIIGLSQRAAGQSGVNKKALEKYEIPLPPLDEQASIVEHFEVLAEHTRTLEAETQERLDQLATLKSSLLDAAFRGQL